MMAEWAVFKNSYRKGTNMLGYVMTGRKFGAGIVAAILGLAISAGTLAQASEIPVTLTDNNSTVQVYSQSDAGIASWTVNGVNQINREWFWYRVGTASSSNPERSIDTLTATDNTVTGNNRLHLAFAQSGQFTIGLSYLLTGGAAGTGSSDLGLMIRVTNTSAQALSFSLFQLADFDLLGSASGDTVQAGRDLHGLYNEVLQQKGTTGLFEAVNSPGANMAQVDIHPAIYNLLTNGQGDDLNNTTGPIGPGNVEWASEWNAVIAPGGVFTISDDQYIQVPEPATLCLLALGRLPLMRRRKK